MFAVIKTGGKQYKVAADDVIKVESLAGEAGEKVTFGVLMLGEGDNTTLGAPLVEGASVTGEIVEQTRAKKVISFYKRRRHNSRRKRGHRQHLTVVKITDILADGTTKPKRSRARKTATEEATPAAEAAASAE